jgi:hypothetical protein
MMMFASVIAGAVTNGAYSQCLYRIIDLHDVEIPNQSMASTINDRGEIVGEFPGIGSFVWLYTANYGLTAQTMHWLQDLIPETPNQAIARGVNGSGKIVGRAHDAEFGTHVGLWDLQSMEYHPLLTDFAWSEGWGLSNSEPPIIVGAYDPPVGASSWGFRYTFGEPTFTPLLPAPGWISATAVAISDPGRAVGGATDDVGGVPGDCSPPIPPAMWWPEDGENMDQGRALTGGSRSAFDINNAHDIVGIARHAVEGGVCYWRATFWPLNSQGEYSAISAVALPFLGGEDEPEHTFARAVTNPTPAGNLQVVGESQLSQAATLWTRSSGAWTVQDLNDISCGPGLPDLILRDATGINNAGFIIGRMDVNPGTPEAAVHAFLLVPRGSSLGDVNLDGVVDEDDMLLLLDGWGTCPECFCFEDLNDDGVVDANDLLLMRDLWGTCPGFEHLDEPESFESVLAARGLSDQHWNQFEDAVRYGTPNERSNYSCWMRRYLSGCQACPSCPGQNPFAN